MTHDRPTVAFNARLSDIYVRPPYSKRDTSRRSFTIGRRISHSAVRRLRPADGQKIRWPAARGGTRTRAWRRTHTPRARVTAHRKTEGEKVPKGKSGAQRDAGAVPVYGGRREDNGGGGGGGVVVEQRRRRRRQGGSEQRSKRGPLSEATVRTRRGIASHTGPSAGTGPRQRPQESPRARGGGRRARARDRDNDRREPHTRLAHVRAARAVNTNRVFSSSATTTFLLSSFCFSFSFFCLLLLLLLLLRLLPVSFSYFRPFFPVAPLPPRRETPRSR